MSISFLPVLHNHEVKTKKNKILYFFVIIHQLFVYKVTFYLICALNTSNLNKGKQVTGGNVHK